ncbi:MAG: hypothetical protein AAFV95_14680 [Bacteroidota bacterium]
MIIRTPFPFALLLFLLAICCLACETDAPQVSEPIEAATSAAADSTDDQPLLGHLLLFGAEAELEAWRVGKDGLELAHRVKAEAVSSPSVGFFAFQKLAGQEMYLDKGQVAKLWKEKEGLAGQQLFSTTPADSVWIRLKEQDVKAIQTFTNAADSLVVCLFPQRPSRGKNTRLSMQSPHWMAAVYGELHSYWQQFGDQ